MVKDSTGVSLVWCVGGGGGGGGVSDFIKDPNDISSAAKHKNIIDGTNKINTIMACFSVDIVDQW